MTDVISNTSPLLYLYRIGGIDWLPWLFNEIWTFDAVKDEMIKSDFSAKNGKVE